ncbi:MAG TPA: hypothetical protein PK723_00820 [Candidatus Pacearchaeota archaeon]|nr:hypothetical protein [Candidatus Pacearchaeota archaeon]HPZ74356.1 hypothetical protein [Candidatus Pacearchaeota archaeon]HQD89040.1 hypothetical protein [Candidatus Pacearchaeota archaeon]
MKNILIADLDGTLVFKDQKISQEVGRYLLEIMKESWLIIIAAASAERVTNLFLEPLWNLGAKEEIENHLLLFSEMGLLEIDPKKAIDNLEDSFIVHLPDGHLRRLKTLREEISKMIWVSPSLWHPLLPQNGGSLFKDYKGRTILLSKESNSPLFPYWILNEEKRVLTTLEKIRSLEGKIIEAPKEVKTSILSFLQNGEVDAIEFPTSFEVKPKGWDKSIPAAMALERIGAQKKCGLNTVVLGDTEHDRAMACPKGLGVNLPFIEIKGEEHLLEVLRAIHRGTII